MNEPIFPEASLPDTTVTPEEGNPAYWLQQYGLQPSDLPEVESISQRIDLNNLTSIQDFGLEISQNLDQSTESILRQVRSRDVEILGKNLEQVLSIAHQTQVLPKTGVAALPVVGALIRRARTLFRKVEDRYASASEQIDSLIREVEQVQESMRQNTQMLEEMYGVVQQEYRALGQYIVAGKLAITRLEQAAAALRSPPELTAMETQELSDMDARIASLDKRVGNFIVLQQAALQKFPMIRMIQANNQTLDEKYHTVRDVVIPSWKHQILLAATLQDQHNTVALADAIDAHTNRMLKQNAALLYKNSTEAAKANQRLSIDPKTLEDVQETLAKTVRDVIAIRRDGIAERKQIESRIQRLQGTMLEIVKGQDHSHTDMAPQSNLH